VIVEQSKDERDDVDSGKCPAEQQLAAHDSAAPTQPKTAANDTAAKAFLSEGSVPAVGSLATVVGSTKAPEKNGALVTVLSVDETTRICRIKYHGTGGTAKIRSRNLRLVSEPTVDQQGEDLKVTVEETATQIAARNKEVARKLEASAKVQEQERARQEQENEKRRARQIAQGLLPCLNYRLDMSASPPLGRCLCGHPKSKHRSTDPAQRQNRRTNSGSKAWAAGARFSEAAASPSASLDSVIGAGLRMPSGGRLESRLMSLGEPTLEPADEKILTREGSIDRQGRSLPRGSLMAATGASQVMRDIPPRALPFEGLESPNSISATRQTRTLTGSAVGTSLGTRLPSLPLWRRASTDSVM